MYGQAKTGWNLASDAGVRISFFFFVGNGHVRLHLFSNSFPLCTVRLIFKLIMYMELFSEELLKKTQEVENRVEDLVFSVKVCSKFLMATVLSSSNAAFIVIVN